AYRQRYNETPKVGSVVGYASLMSIAAGLKRAGGTDTEKLVDAFAGLQVDTPFGPVTYRAIDHQSTMGVFVGVTALQDGQGIMKDFSYLDGSRLQPPDQYVRRLHGLADASALFLVAAGLSLIFGVTRIVNFAHGSFYMLGVYLACTLTAWLGGSALGYWAALPLAALAVGGLGAAIEILVLRRIYHAPELFQLLATFALVLIIGDAALALWGPADLFAARAPGVGGAVEILGRRSPQSDLLLIALGPLVLGLLWLLLMRTRWGRLLRAAAENRSMLAALGVNQAWLFTSAFALGAFLAGLGGAMAAPRTPATLGLDLEIIASAF